VDGTERPCPICGEPMTHQPVYGITVALCTRHGLWADRDQLRMIRRRIQLKQQTLSRLARHEERRPVIDWALPSGHGEHPNTALVPEGQRPCPVCGQHMATETRHGIAADVCRDHGVWLDRGELYAIQRTTRAREVRLQALAAQAASPDYQFDDVWLWLRVLLAMLTGL